MHMNVSPNMKKASTFFFIILIGILGVLGYRVMVLEKERNENYLIPKSFPAQVQTPKEGIFESSVQAKDPQNGSSGDVRLSLDDSKQPLELSWPSNYSLQSFRLYFLGQSEDMIDNVILEDFVISTPVNSIVEGNKVTHEREKFASPLVLGTLRPEMVFSRPRVQGFLDQKRGSRFAIEAYFTRGDDDKIYQGVLTFTY